MCNVRATSIGEGSVAMVKKAVVLAAGHGTRLRPFTCVTPKPLMPVWGETMLDRMMSLLRERGVDDFIVNSHHLHEQIREWSDAYRSAAQTQGEKVRIKVSYEPEILGNGGVLNPIRDWIGDEPFYLVNSDIIVENMPDLGAAFELARTDEDVLGVCLVTKEGPRTIEVEPMSSFVTNWRSDDAGMNGTFTYCGISILKPRVLDFVKPEGFSSIVSAYEKAMMAGLFMRAIQSDNFLWEDAGTIARYIDLNWDGNENAFADIPQLKATEAKDFKFLSARGSDRVFFGCNRGIAILYDDGNRNENGKYPGHARWLKAKGMPVPKVLFDDAAAKTLVLENAGTERKMSLEDYVKIVETLVRFNALGAESDLPDLLPPFDDETWEWEHGLFAKHCLGSRFGMTLPSEVRKELGHVAMLLECEPKALVHRDFQSTNILWKGDSFSFIDFQGMRLGPAAYDLASLVYDPYVTFTEGERRALIALYAKKSGREDMPKILPFAAIQRLVQCLGAYGRLTSVGQPQFGRYVLPALVNLLDASDRAGLDALGALAEDLIAKEKSASHASPHDGNCCSCGHHHSNHDGPCACGHDHSCA